MPEPVASPTELTRDYLKKNHGGRGRLYPMFEHLTPDVAVWNDDFMGAPAIQPSAGGAYQLTASGTASAVAAIVVGTVNGAVRLNAGTADDGRSDLSLGLNFRGDLSCAIMVKLEVTDILAMKLEVGFTDVISGTDAGAVNDVSAPTFTATDAVLWIQDTDDGGNANLQCVGVDSGTAATKIEDGQTMVVNTQLTLGIEVRENPSGTDTCSAKFYRGDANGLITYESDWMDLAISDNVLLTPWIFAQNRGASTNLDVTIDYIKVWQRRTSS